MDFSFTLSTNSSLIPSQQSAFKNTPLSAIIRTRSKVRLLCSKQVEPLSPAAAVCDQHKGRTVKTGKERRKTSVSPFPFRLFWQTKTRFFHIGTCAADIRCSKYLFWSTVEGKRVERWVQSDSISSQRGFLAGRLSVLSVCF